MEENQIIDRTANQDWVFHNYLRYIKKKIRCLEIESNIINRY